jgi:hypothetical protein
VYIFFAFYVCMGYAGHVKAIELLKKGTPGGAGVEAVAAGEPCLHTFNLGTGKPTSVLEVRQ